MPINNAWLSVFRVVGLFIFISSSRCINGSENDDTATPASSFISISFRQIRAGLMAVFFEYATELTDLVVAGIAKAGKMTGFGFAVFMAFIGQRLVVAGH
ncbi:MAG: hypothetical protein MZV70_44905 [Desulfobacterales bacterium]|nr:hypothetical protein [Desulfobacterales bacterium]